MTQSKTAEQNHRLLVQLFCSTEGRALLGDAWNVGPSEVSRKLSGQSGISLEQFAAALAALGAQVVGPEAAVVSSDYLHAVEQALYEHLKHKLEKD